MNGTAAVVGKKRLAAGEQASLMARRIHRLIISFLSARTLGHSLSCGS